MKNSYTLYWIVQIISWGMFSALIGAAAYLQGEFSQRTIYQLLGLFLLLIIAAHSIRWILIKKDWLNKNITALIPRVLLLISCISTLILLLYTSINNLVYDEKWSSMVELFLNILLYAIFLSLWTAVYLTYHLLQKSRTQEIRNLKLLSSQTENELKTLRNQLNPHFLFNLLNSIRALVGIDPEKAKSTITTLSSLLRSSLLLGKKHFISLSEELKLVDEYLQLEKVRYENRLNYSIQNSVEETVEIPPFILQGMVENAIKHGISKSSENGKILISVFYEKEKLLLQVENTGTYTEKNNNGIGISNTIRRLELIYGNEAGFTIKNENNLVKSNIWINKNKLITHESNNNR